MPLVTPRVAAVLTLLLASAGTSACKKAPSTETHTFFQNEEDLVRNPVEIRYPPLDLAAAGDAGAYIGVTTLGGGLRFSRPANWQVRRGSSAAEHRYVEYVSPNEYLFAIYQRSDSTCSSWGDVIALYEADAKKRGVEFQAKEIPTTGDDTQGREYIVRRKVKGQKAPYTNTSREFIFRGKHSYALVELVHQGESDAAVEGEVLRAIQTLRVL
jgi:hypothetical protein